MSASQKLTCHLNREVKWTVKTALSSALEAMMSCDFIVSNVRHLEGQSGRRLRCQGMVCSYFVAKILLLVVGIIVGYAESTCINVCLGTGTHAHESLHSAYKWQGENQTRMLADDEKMPI